MNLKPGQVSVTLIFDSEVAKRHVMGQLSDGWGENYVDLDWPGDLEFHESPWFEVMPIDDNWLDKYGDDV